MHAYIICAINVRKASNHKLAFFIWFIAFQFGTAEYGEAFYIYRSLVTDYWLLIALSPVRREKFVCSFAALGIIQAKKIISQIKDEPGSRREYLPAEASAQAGMLEYFYKEAEKIKRNQQYKVWQDGNQPNEMSGSIDIFQKIDYIHNNPVDEMIVENSWDYLYSFSKGLC